MPYKSQVHNIPVLLLPKCLCVENVTKIIYGVYIYVHV